MLKNMFWWLQQYFFSLVGLQRVSGATYPATSCPWCHIFEVGFTLEWTRHAEWPSLESNIGPEGSATSQPPNTLLFYLLSGLLFFSISPQLSSTDCFCHVRMGKSKSDRSRRNKVIRDECTLTKGPPQRLRPLRDSITAHISPFGKCEKCSRLHYGRMSCVSDGLQMERAGAKWSCGRMRRAPH